MDICRITLSRFGMVRNPGLASDNARQMSTSAMASPHDLIDDERSSSSLLLGAVGKLASVVKLGYWEASLCC